MSIFVGLPSPSRGDQNGGFQRTQTIGQRIMGNMMDNLFVRSFTTKAKSPTADAVPSSPSKVLWYHISPLADQL